MKKIQERRKEGKNLRSAECHMFSSKSQAPRIHNNIPHLMYYLKGKDHRYRHSWFLCLTVLHLIPSLGVEYKPETNIRVAPQWNALSVTHSSLPETPCTPAL